MAPHHVLGKFAVLLVFVALALLPKSLFAGDRKTYSASNCVVASSDDVQGAISSGAISNYSSTSSLVVQCPIVRDNTTKKFPQSISVNLHQNCNSFASVTLRGRNTSGNAFTPVTVSPTTTGDVTVSMSFTSQSAPTAQVIWLAVVLRPYACSDAQTLYSYTVDEY